MQLVKCVLDVICTDSVECAIHHDLVQVLNFRILYCLELFRQGAASLIQALVGQTQLHKARAEDSLEDGASMDLTCSGRDWAIR